MDLTSKPIDTMSPHERYLHIMELFRCDLLIAQEFLSREAQNDLLDEIITELEDARDKVRKKIESRGFSG